MRHGTSPSADASFTGCSHRDQRCQTGRSSPTAGPARNTSSSPSGLRETVLQGMAGRRSSHGCASPVTRNQRHPTPSLADSHTRLNGANSRHRTSGPAGSAARDNTLVVRGKTHSRSPRVPRRPLAPSRPRGRTAPLSSPSATGRAPRPARELPPVHPASPGSKPTGDPDGYASNSRSMWYLERLRLDQEEGGLTVVEPSFSRAHRCRPVDMGPGSRPRS